MDDDEYDYNRTVEELACLDSLSKLGKQYLNSKHNQFSANKF